MNCLKAKIFDFIPLIIALTILTGCDGDKFNTSHPNEGGVILTMDWSNIESAVPPTYQAYVTTSSGQNKFFDNLSGVTNNLVVDPGEAVLYVYNNAEHISVSGNKAIIANDGAGIVANPGFFYTFSKQIVTERDNDIEQIALMNRQTGELKIALAIKPASMIANIQKISAVLEGVASELDMQTNELYASSTVPVNFSISGFYARADLRLFGFIRRNAQNIRFEVEFKNGNKTSVTSDISSYIADFNLSKNKPFSLNAEMYVPENNNSATTIDRWEYNTESRYLSVYPSIIDFSNDASSETVTIATDQTSWTYSISQSGDWLSCSTSNVRLTISASANPDSDTRQATVFISSGGLSETITVTQRGFDTNDYYSDKQTVILQRATIGKGINIVLMGDGYTINEMKKETGKYEQDMRAAVDHFFSVYPISEYRNYFNVYMITAISNQAGISNQQTHTILDTRFKATWEGGNSTGIDCNDGVVFEYVNAIAELSSINLFEITVIMPINAYIYAGTCFMYRDRDFSPQNYGKGFSISLCPVGRYFKETVLHEAAGHGFSKVTDEYIYYREDSIPVSDKGYLKNLKDYGWFENVDFSDDISETSWSGFAGLPKYSMVDAFEGAYYYGKGIWRPEYNSCMNNNAPYFNAPTRWAQVSRINQYAGINYSFSQFLQDDEIPAYALSTRSQVETIIPLAPPVIKIMSFSPFWGIVR